MKGHFEAKKHAIRQTQDGWVVSFVVHPNDMTPEFAAAPLGTRLMVGYAEIGDDEQPTPEPPKAPDNAASERAKEAYRNKPEWQKAATRAVMLCKDAKFQRWLRLTSGLMLDPSKEGGWEDAAATYVRNFIGGNSRADIGIREDVYNRFVVLETSYRQETGQFAEQRS